MPDSIHGPQPAENTESAVRSNAVQAVGVETEHHDVHDPSSLNKMEKGWRMFQPFMERRGYMLRPRYRPGWIGSWVGTGMRPEDCEDSIPIPKSSSVLDAIRQSDGKQVLLKLSGEEELSGPELRILHYFSSDRLASNPRNHCVPLLDVFPLEGPNGLVEHGNVIVEPLLRDWRAPPFRMVIEGLSFIKQLLEGLEFMHSHNVAHRDIHSGNILMDARALFPDGFHGAFNLNRHRRMSEAGLRSFTRLQVPVKYYYIDFGLSTKFPSFEERRLVNFVEGFHRDLPELRTDRNALYDPFKADVHALGTVFLNYFVGRTGLDFMAPLILCMLFEKVEDRPTASECVITFEYMTRDLPWWRLVARLGWHRGEMGWREWAGDLVAYLRLLWHALTEKGGLSGLRRRHLRNC